MLSNGASNLELKWKEIHAHQMTKDNHVWMLVYIASEFITYNTSCVHCKANIEIIIKYGK